MRAIDQPIGVDADPRRPGLDQMQRQRCAVACARGDDEPIGMAAAQHHLLDPADTSPGHARPQSVQAKARLRLEQSQRDDRFAAGNGGQQRVFLVLRASRRHQPRAQDQRRQHRLHRDEAPQRFHHRDDVHRRTAKATRFFGQRERQ